MNIFGRYTKNGNVELFYSSGEAVTKIYTDEFKEIIYPVGSELSWFYEHPEGIIISAEDAEKIGIEIE